MPNPQQPMQAGATVSAPQQPLPSLQQVMQMHQAIHGANPSNTPNPTLGQQIDPGRQIPQAPHQGMQRVGYGVYRGPNGQLFGNNGQLLPQPQQQMQPQQHSMPQNGNVNTMPVGQPSFPQGGMPMPAQPINANPLQPGQPYQGYNPTQQITPGQYQPGQYNTMPVAQPNYLTPAQPGSMPGKITYG